MVRPHMSEHVPSHLVDVAEAWYDSGGPPESGLRLLASIVEHVKYYKDAAILPPLWKRQPDRCGDTIDDGCIRCRTFIKKATGGRPAQEARTSRPRMDALPDGRIDVEVDSTNWSATFTPDRTVIVNHEGGQFTTNWDTIKQVAAVTP